MKQTCSYFLTFVFSMVLGLIIFTGVQAAEAPPPLDVVKWDYPPKFPNVTMNLVGDAGHNLKPYEFWKSEFQKAGINIQIIEVPFSGVYEKERPSLSPKPGHSMWSPFILLISVILPAMAIWSRWISTCRNLRHPFGIPILRMY